MVVARRDAYLYFAYGSNMSSERLRARAPSARSLGAARLLHYVRRWHKMGRDGSGKCDVVYCGADSRAVVWGVLYEIDRADQAALDRAEELGVGYVEQVVEVLAENGPCAAFTYLAIPERTDAALRPLGWYKAHVLRGAREHGLPAACLRELEQVDVEPE